MIVEASIYIDAPRDDVFDILTEYGSDVRVRVVPHLKAQSILHREDNVFLCENEWERDGKQIRQHRRYTIFPPDRIEEEVVGANEGMTHVTTRLDPDGDGTRLTMESEYVLTGALRLLGKLAANQLHQSDETLLEELRTRIEAEFEEVVDDVGES